MTKFQLETRVNKVTFVFAGPFNSFKEAQNHLSNIPTQADCILVNGCLLIKKSDVHITLVDKEDACKNLFL